MINCCDVHDDVETPVVQACAPWLYTENYRYSPWPSYSVNIQDSAIFESKNNPVRQQCHEVFNDDIKEVKI